MTLSGTMRRLDKRLSMGYTVNVAPSCPAPPMRSVSVLPLSHEELRDRSVLLVLHWAPGRDRTYCFSLPEPPRSNRCKKGFEAFYGNQSLCGEPVLRRH